MTDKAVYLKHFAEAMDVLDRFAARLVITHDAIPPDTIYNEPIGAYRGIHHYKTKPSQRAAIFASLKERGFRVEQRFKDHTNYVYKSDDWKLPSAMIQFRRDGEVVLFYPIPNEFFE